MNQIRASIVQIESAGHISLVDLESSGQHFSCVVIETPETASYLKIGNTVTLLFKETEVSIAKNWQGEISLRNRLEGTIKHIEKGIVLSKIVLDYLDTEITSIITTRSANKLALKTGEKVCGFIKANEVSILSE